MERTYLAFDLETAKVQSSNLKHWTTKRPLGISCAATYAEDDRGPVLLWGGRRRKHPTFQMTVAEARALVEYLGKRLSLGYTIVTWNGIGFDFDILAEESRMPEECRSIALSHVDMMFQVLCQLGFGVSLNAAARGMRLSRKGRGLQGSLMPRLWTEGRFDDVFEHVAQDARITLALAKTCDRSGYLRWITRYGTGRMMQLPQGWQTVEVARHLPETNRKWLPKQWSRDNFTAWMQLVTDGMSGR